MTSEQLTAYLRDIAAQRIHLDRLEREALSMPLDGPRVSAVPPQRYEGSGVSTPPVAEPPVGRVMTRQPLWATMRQEPQPTTTAPQLDGIKALTTPDAVRSGAYAQNRQQIMSELKRAQAPSSITPSGHAFTGSSLIALSEQTEQPPTLPHPLWDGMKQPTFAPPSPIVQSRGYGTNFAAAPLAMQKINNSRVGAKAVAKAKAV